jgi:hypothetical protein
METRGGKIPGSYIHVKCNSASSASIYNMLVLYITSLNNTTKREEYFQAGDSPTHFYTKLSQLAWGFSFNRIQIWIWRMETLRA